MILSDVTIREELAAGRIVIDPLGDDAVQPSSVDLHVDRYFRVFRNDTTPYIDPKQHQEDLTELVEVGDEGAFILHPGEFVLGSTLERVALPDDLVARLEGKSLAWPSRAAHPQHRGLRRRGLGRAPHARALERREPPDRALPGHEDRADLLPANDHRGRAPVRESDDRFQVPRAAGPTPSRYYLNFRDRGARGVRCRHAANGRARSRSWSPTTTTSGVCRRTTTPSSSSCSPSKARRQG